MWRNIKSLSLGSNVQAINALAIPVLPGMRKHTRLQVGWPPHIICVCHHAELLVSVQHWWQESKWWSRDLRLKKCWVSSADRNSHISPSVVFLKCALRASYTVTLGGWVGGGAGKHADSRASHSLLMYPFYRLGGRKQRKHVNLLLL